MSEETKGTAAPESAPVETAPAAAEQAPAEQPKTEEPTKAGPRTSPRTQQRRQAHDRAARLEHARAQAEAARERALSQPREEAGKATQEGEPAGGRFKKEGGEEAAAAPAPEAQPRAESQADAGAKPPATEASATPDGAAPGKEPVPDGMVRIPLPEDHPWRQRGHTYWDAPKHLENETRAAVNAVAERHQLRQQLERQAEERAILEARIKARESDLPFKPDPRMEHLLKDIERNYSAEEAELIRRGLDSLNETTLTRAELRARQEIVEQRQGREFYESVHAEAARRFPVWAEQGVVKRYMDSAVRQWGRIVDANNAQRAHQGLEPIGLNTEDFFRWAATKYASEPAVLAAMRAKQEQERETERERIRREERERIQAEERQKLEEAAGRHRTLPPSTPGAVSAGRVADTVTAAEDQPKTRTERRRAIAERYAGR